MSAEMQQGKVRPRALRTDREPSADVAALAAPVRDPRTGQWASGNPGGRLRQLAALAKAEAESLLRLDVEQVAPWLRPHLADAQAHCQRLLDDLAVQDEELIALCADEARARFISRAAMAEGCRDGATPADARSARDESRAWSREARQIALTRRTLEREAQSRAPKGDAIPPWFERSDDGATVDTSDEADTAAGRMGAEEGSDA